jgi:hypothetical protein
MICLQAPLAATSAGCKAVAAAAAVVVAQAVHLMDWAVVGAVAVEVSRAGPGDL